MLNLRIEITMSIDDARYLKQIANRLNISEMEVIRKGVKLMHLYSQSYNDPNTKLTLETSKTKQDILVL